MMAYRKHQIISRENETKNRNVYLLALVVNVNPECRVLFLESIERTRKAGSLNEVRAIFRFHTDRKITGSRKNVDVFGMGMSRIQMLRQQRDPRTMEKLLEPSVKASPDEHSTPNIAQIPPGLIESTS